MKCGNHSQEQTKRLAGREDLRVRALLKQSRRRIGIQVLLLTGTLQKNGQIELGSQSHTMAVDFIFLSFMGVVQLGLQVMCYVGSGVVNRRLWLVAETGHSFNCHLCQESVSAQNTKHLC